VDIKLDCLRRTGRGKFPEAAKPRTPNGIQRRLNLPTVAVKRSSTSEQ